ncbi:MAG: DinB family protein [bacterium]
MSSTPEPEVWLRGALPGIPPLLQPVAHGLMQCQAEVGATLPVLTTKQIWSRPENIASIGYHVRHAIGSLDRLFTYARGEQLSRAQLATLRFEGDASIGPETADELIAAFNAEVARAMGRLYGIREATLLEPREVGRARLPSTVIGLLFHAAEHTQRHVGQLVTTARVLRGVDPG